LLATGEHKIKVKYIKVRKYKTTARRLDIIEEYYFSSKLREVRQLALEGKPIINMELEAQTCGHHNPLLML
jgi:hypothetical protein